LQFRFFNRAVNPVVRVLLRSRLGIRLGRAVALLTYTGPVSGREVTLPVEYALDGEGRYVIVPGHPEKKGWWRNFRRERHVRLRFRDREVGGEARLLDDPVEIEGALAVYLRRFPAGGRSIGVHLSPDGAPEPEALAAVAPTVVVLRVVPS
jgi:hypothetical protein